MTESRSLDDEMFGEQRLLSLLGAKEAAPAAEIVRALVEAEEQFRRPLGQRDDLTLLAARRLG